MPVASPVICDYCGKPAERVTGKEVYPHRPDLFGKKIWMCRPCDARVGSHPNGRPLGRLANAELRSLRMEAHSLFDPFWKDGVLTRNGAYRLLAQELGIPPKQAHIGRSDEELCRRIIEVCRRWRINPPTRHLPEHPQEPRRPPSQ